MKRPVPHIVPLQTRPLEHIVVKARVAKPAQWASDSQFRVNDTTRGDENVIVSGTKERSSGPSLDVRLNWSLVVFCPSHKVLTHSSLCSDPDPVPSRTTQGVFVFSRPPERQILMFSFKLVRILGENRVCLFMWTEGCENKRTIQTNLPKHFLFSVKI